MKKELIIININNKIINAKIKKEFSLMFNKEKMKKFFELINTPIIEIINNNIILKEFIYDFLSLKELIYIIILDLENNIVMNEIIDMKIHEK